MYGELTVDIYQKFTFIFSRLKALETNGTESLNISNGAVKAID